MQRLKLLAPILLLTLLLTACPPADQQARDVNAALSGAIHAAQDQYLTSCKANPSQSVCVQINQAVDGQNALASSVEIYCGWPAGTPLDTTTPCSAHPDALAAMKAAATRAQQLTNEVKGLVKP